MARIASAKRYAQAVFEMARDSDKLEEWRGDLAVIAEAGGDSQLAVLLQNPKVSFDQKKELLGQVLSDVDPLAMNLAYILVARGRWAIAGAIANEYNLLADAYEGIEHAEVITAVPIDDEDERRLRERLVQITGKEVVTSTKVEPAIMGGLVAKIGDKLLDASTRTKLLALRSRIAEGAR